MYKQLEVLRVLTLERASPTCAASSTIDRNRSLRWSAISIQTLSQSIARHRQRHVDDKWCSIRYGRGNSKGRRNPSLDAWIKTYRW